MTLVTPSRKRPPAYHKKLSAGHHKRSKHYNKTYWPYLPLLAIVVLGALFNGVISGGHSVLGYATDVSAQNLLIDTNNQRQANGEAALTLNDKLDTAAQAKANDMAARNYWAHNTPDGQTPWTFITSAGYSYQLAGENLAYGFTTAADTLTGWMNSPEHRANILNAGYKEVGFGFINIPNYQNNGPETLVVAMYGTQPATEPIVTSAPAPTTGSSQQAAAGTPVVVPSPQPVQAEAAAPAPTINQTQVVTPQTVQTAAVAPKQRDISRIQLLTAGKAPWSMFVLSLAGSAALTAFLLRHGLAWHKIFVQGEQFVLHHPWLDASLVAVVTLAFILAQQTGVIR